MNQRILSSTGNQLTAAASHTIYNGSIDCAVQVSFNQTLRRSTKADKNLRNLQTVRNEGFAALYKGFIPTWVRMVKQLTFRSGSVCEY